MGLEEPGSELVVEEEVAFAVGERLVALSRLVPDWPMSSHVIPMNGDADLSPPSQAKLVAELVGALGLERATIVGNDTRGAVSQLVATRHPEAVERLVLTNCDSFNTFPPFPFNLMPPIARLPGDMTMLQAPFRIGAVARATYGLLAKREIPAELVASWTAPGRKSEIRRDTRKLLAGIHKRQTLEAGERLKAFDRPALLTWGVDDRFFKLELAERLRETIPDSRRELVEDAKTFSPLDQPGRIGGLMAEFYARGRSLPRRNRTTSGPSRNVHHLR